MVHLALQNAKVFPDYVEDPHFPQAEMSDEHIVFEKTGTSEFVHVFEPTAYFTFHIIKSTICSHAHTHTTHTLLNSNQIIYDEICNLFKH
jgi:hypothetical protein